MATIKKYLPGEFCWADLGTKNTAAAKKFYRGIFGWQVKDHPMGGGGIYSMLQIKGKEICALYPMSPEQKKAKRPPMWLPYITVANVDRTIKKAKAAGATLCMGPVDVPGAGRMADTAVAGKFYTKVFGWKIKTMDFSGNSYHLFNLGKKGIGGMWPYALPKHGPAWFTYWGVKNCAKTVAKVKRLGGKVLLGPITVPNTCTFAIIRDPQGASLGVLHPLA